MQQRNQSKGERSDLLPPAAPVSPTSSTTVLLWNIKEALPRYHTTACDLFHEKINAIYHTDNLGEGKPGEMSVTRVGFCPPQVRRWRLSCAHTTAAFEFVRLLQPLFDAGLLSVHLSLQQFRDLCTQIYLLDHQKGAIEKQLAILRCQKPEEDEIEALAWQLQKKIQTHRALTKELDQFLQVTKEAVDRLLSAPT